MYTTSWFLMQLGSQWHLTKTSVIGSAEALELLYSINGRLHWTLGVSNTDILPLVLHPDRAVRENDLNKFKVWGGGGDCFSASYNLSRCLYNIDCHSDVLRWVENASKTPFLWVFLDKMEILCKQVSSSSLFLELYTELFQFHYLFFNKFGPLWISLLNCPRFS